LYGDGLDDLIVSSPEATIKSSKPSPLDGLDDLIVGAHNADPSGKSNAGKSYIIFGKIDSTAINLFTIASGTGGFVINGETEHDISGYSVSTAGDVNEQSNHPLHRR
jgi:hypothetical protein